MKKRSVLQAFAFIVACHSVFVAGTAHADSAVLRSALTPTAAAPDATGVMTGSFADKASTFRVEVSRLTANTTFDLRVNNLVEATFTTNARGAAKLEFRSPARPKGLALDFDPRAATVDVSQNGVSSLEGTFSGQGEASGATADEQAYLTNNVAGSKARASARFVQDAKGNRRFTVDVAGAVNGSAQLLVNGQQAAELIIAHGRGSLRFESGKVGKASLLLTFDPRGATLDLMQAGSVIFTGNMKAKAFGANVDKRSAFLLPIPAVADTVKGNAKATWRVTDKAVRKFSVEVEDADNGDYSLSVNGVLKGTFTVSGHAGGIEFSNHPDGEALQLDFDPVQATLSLALGDQVQFSGVFDPTVLASKPAPEAASRLDENLTSTGLVPAATATARYEVDHNGRHRFKVELENTAAGVYTLRVGGVIRSSIRAILNGAAVHGEVEFSTITEAGKLSLNFDPRGQLVEIANATGEILFSHLLGSGSAPAPGTGTGAGGATGPLLIQAALIAAPGSGGSVTYTYQRDADGSASLKLRAQNLPAGSYDIAVGGASRGTLIVPPDDHGTEGELEFDDTPKNDQVLLDFTVLGQEISVSQGANLLFSRTVPLQ